MKMTDSTKTETAATPAQRAVVHLECQAPEAKAVFVAGTFNDWQPDTMPLQQETSGFWTIDLELAPGVHEYRFVVDGSWCSDPGATETTPNPFGGENAVLRVP